MAAPTLPAPISKFVSYLAKEKDINKALAPYRTFENRLREVFAQEPDHPIIADPHVNTVPLYAGDEVLVKIRARDLPNESIEQKEKYLLSLPEEHRKKNGSPAIVSSMKEFKTNFNLFSEASLVDLDWSNVVAAGSSVVTSLLPVQAPHNESKRALRAYYHEKLAPASDVDLFIYGLGEEQAIEKIKEIEAKIRDSILEETTTIRTKNAITIVSAYPTRHVQIVLRLYKSVSEILTGFDVDCSCVAYDGRMVWASPRAIAAYATQINPVDLTRRSPSYENRLSKYSHRGFEVYWPGLDRSRIDPTIFERSFSRVMGLARMLVLEKLPHPNDRDAYLDKRRAERGRPPLPWNARHQQKLHGNIKDSQPDDIAEWVEEDDVSNYHTFTVPYGLKFNAKKIEKLLFTKDLLLNAEWNRPKDREANLHRHPAFFGSVDHVIHDCCGFCPKPTTDEDLAAAEEESKIYISGDVEFIKDNPGRQTIGSFNPITDDDWTEMAYIGNTERLCQAIVDGDLEHVQDWCEQEGADVNRRDATGRTPLQLASLCSTTEIVQCLIDHGGRIVSRLVDGFTALHIAARRGHVPIIKALLDKSEANAEDEERKNEAKKTARRANVQKLHSPVATSEEDKDQDVDELESEDNSDDSDQMTDASFVKVPANAPGDQGVPDDTDKDEPDVYNVDVLAWDSPVSPLHLAIMGGHVDAILELVNNFGADTLLPIKLVDSYSKSPRAAILTLVLAAQNEEVVVQSRLLQSVTNLTMEEPLPLSDGLLQPASVSQLVRTLMKLGASSTQADMNEISALHHIVNQGSTETLEVLTELDRPAASRAINYVTISGWQHQPQVDTPLLTAIRGCHYAVVQKLLELGAHPAIEFDEFAKAYQRKWEHASKDPEEVKKVYQKSVDQPIIEAAQQELPSVVKQLLEMQVDVNTLPKSSFQRVENPYSHYNSEDKSLLDLIQDKLKALEDFRANRPEENIPVAPAPLEADEEYLQSFSPGSYKYWLAAGDLQQAKAILRIQNEQYHKDVAEVQASKNAKGTAEKRYAVQALAAEYLKLKQYLLSRGAKTFYELYPDIKKPDQNDRNNHGFGHVSHGLNRKPYFTNLGFLVPDLTPPYKAGYFELFEAAWEGNLEKVKELTLGSWAENRQPLKIAVQDLRGLSTFSIAVLRGHEDLAKIVLDIAAAQYQPKEDAERFRYSLYSAESDNGDTVDDDEENVKVYGELVDDHFTVNDIGALADNVKSRVSPMRLLEWPAEVWRFMGDEFSESTAKQTLIPQPENLNVYIGQESKQSWSWFHAVFNNECARCSSSLVRLAIAKNDMKILKFFLAIGSDLAARKAGEEASRLFTISTSDFDFAVQLGRNEMLGEIIRSTGAGIPLQKMVKTSGIDISEKPKYYQGLSVYGKKRKDWADAGRGLSRNVAESEHSTALSVAFQGNLDALEYFLSDTPLRKYIDFANAHVGDKRIAALGKGPGGIERALSTWLGTRCDLMIHLAVMSRPKEDGSNPTLDFLLRTRPDWIDVKSSSGSTPLQLAFQLQRYFAARTLIAKGANQQTHGVNGENILHSILRNVTSAALFTSVLKLIDPALIEPMFLEKCAEDPGSLTPLALFVRTRIHHLRHSEVQSILDIIFGHSQGKDLEMLDGAGDSPLHYLVRNKKTSLARFVINYNTSLLYQESATGMTPLDVAFTTYLRSRMDNPSTIAGSRNQYFHHAHAANTDILSRSAADFVKHQNSSNKKYKEDAAGMWKMCDEVARSQPAKRKLVTLFDANEVAKRLALSQQKRQKSNEGLGRRNHRQGYGRGEEFASGAEEEARGDEVSQWINIAAGFPKIDLDNFQSELTEMDTGA